VQRRMTCEMPSNVMEPTIAKGSVVAVDTAYYYENEPQRWDVLVFTAPQVEQMQFDLGRQKIAPEPIAAVVNAAADLHARESVLVRPHLFFVKRIVGLPGERIRFTPEAIMCDDQPLHVPRDLARCYVRFKDCADYAFGGTNEYVVPFNSVFVLSDNLTAGKDSRRIGAVSLHNVIGRVIL